MTEGTVFTGIKFKAANQFQSLDCERLVETKPLDFNIYD
jgi:hypothetical protein